MLANNTILSTSANKWWNSLTGEKQIELCKKYGFDSTYSLVNFELLHIYNGEHPGKSPEDFEKDIQERKEEWILKDITPWRLSVVIGEGKEEDIVCSIHGNGNYPEIRKRAELITSAPKLKEQNTVLVESIEEMNRKYLEVKAHVKVLREALEQAEYIIRMIDSGLPLNPQDVRLSGENALKVLEQTK